MRLISWTRHCGSGHVVLKILQKITDEYLHYYLIKEKQKLELSHCAHSPQVSEKSTKIVLPVHGFGA